MHRTSLSYENVKNVPDFENLFKLYLDSVLSFSLVDVNFPSLNVRYAELNSKEDIISIRDKLLDELRDVSQKHAASILDDMMAETLSIFHELCVVHACSSIASTSSNASKRSEEDWKQKLIKTEEECSYLSDRCCKLSADVIALSAQLALSELRYNETKIQLDEMSLAKDASNAPLPVISMEPSAPPELQLQLLAAEEKVKELQKQMVDVLYAQATSVAEEVEKERARFEEARMKAEKQTLDLMDEVRSEVQCIGAIVSSCSVRMQS